MAEPALLVVGAHIPLVLENLACPPSPRPARLLEDPLPLSLSLCWRPRRAGVVGCSLLSPLLSILEIQLPG